MKTNSFDVVIVGAGLAGLTAAAAAASSPGIRVALVTTGPGSFVFGFGSLKDFSSLSDSSSIQEATTFWCDITRSAGCPFLGDLFTAHYLPTLMGEFQSVAFAPATVWSGHPQTGRTGIIGIRGCSSFDPNFLAERLNENASKFGLGSVYLAREIALHSSLGFPLTTLRIALRFDTDAGFRAELSGLLRDAARECSSILIPGVLGLRSGQQQHAEFEAELGCPVSELPTLPPSIPALRVYQRMMMHLQKIGVELYRGFPVSELNVEDCQFTQLTIESPGRHTVLRGQKVILATGQYSTELLGSEIAGHDSQLRPLDAQGKVIAEHWYAAGSLIDHGVGGDAAAVVTGYRAGKLAAKEVSHANR